MTRKSKAFGLALISVFVMSALAASAAWAGELELPAGVTEATITGEQINGSVTGIVTPVNQFKTDAGVIKCTPATFHAFAKTATPKELMLAPTYGNTPIGTGCTIAGLAGPLIHMNGCTFLYTLQAGGPPTAVETHVVCPAGQVITITASGSCTITVGGGQKFASSMVSVANAGGANPNMDVVATVDVVGIDYVEHGTCPNGGGNTATTTNGEYKGVVTLKGDQIGCGPAVGVTLK
jgi:hypothetical protein